MALKDIIRSNKKQDKIVLTEDYIKDHLKEFQNLIAFWRVYPDVFIDTFAREGTTFDFHPYQRLFLRCFLRYKETYITAPRGASKSFLAFLGKLVEGVLYPHVNLFGTTSQKNQAAAILLQSVNAVFNKIPFLKDEINFERGHTKMAAENVKLIFKNGSTLDVLPPVESSRGARRHSGVIEEIALVDMTALNEIIFPVASDVRQLPDGSRPGYEVINSGWDMITTAGYKSSSAYDKLMEILTKQVIQEPQQSIMIGCTWRIPRKEGMYAPGYIEKYKTDATYGEESFRREFDSEWAGSVDGAFFNVEKFDNSRVLTEAESKYNEIACQKNKLAYYIMGVDVGRVKCTTEVCVFRVMPNPGELSTKCLVGLYSLPDMEFEKQAIRLKQIFFKYKCRTMVLDVNGIGRGLMDVMVKEQFDPETGESLPPLMPENDVANAYHDKIYKEIPANGILNAVYMMIANNDINTEAHTYVKSNLGTKYLKLLIDEQEASARLAQSEFGKDYSPQQRAEYLIPFTLTTVLRDQMMALINTATEGKDIKLKLNTGSSSGSKDRFSAFEYGIWYVQKKDNESKKKKGKWSQFMFFN